VPLTSVRSRRRRRLIAAIALVAAIVAVVVIVAVLTSTRGADAAPPRPGMPLLVPSDSEAARAADAAAEGSDAQRAAAYLADMPTAVWLTPEEAGIGEIGDEVAALAAEAREQSAALTLVVYGLPERDCGQYSAGGLPADDYDEWTAAIGAALAAASDVPAIVILEPDALALAPECGNVDDRVAQLQAAIDALSQEGAANTWIYLDAGHSNWLPVGEIAALLERAGVERVRGFATNVSNYYGLDEETAYAHELSETLEGTHGIEGAHAVIDTSRNGAGSDGEWCNPPGRLVGEEGGTTGDDVVDLNLWIKPPGESDGTCNGGPAAGRWWPEAAIELTRMSFR
jgi:endoglucanase